MLIADIIKAAFDIASMVFPPEVTRSSEQAANDIIRNADSAFVQIGVTSPLSAIHNDLPEPMGNGSTRHGFLMTVDPSPVDGPLLDALNTLSEQAAKDRDFDAFVVKVEQFISTRMKG